MQLKSMVTMLLRGYCGRQLNYTRVLLAFVAHICSLTLLLPTAEIIEAGGQKLKRVASGTAAALGGPQEVAEPFLRQLLSKVEAAQYSAHEVAAETHEAAAETYEAAAETVSEYAVEGF